MQRERRQITRRTMDDGTPAPQPSSLLSPTSPDPHPFTAVSFSLPTSPDATPQPGRLASLTAALAREAQYQDAGMDSESEVANAVVNASDVEGAASDAPPRRRPGRPPKSKLATQGSSTVILGTAPAVPKTRARGPTSNPPSQPGSRANSKPGSRANSKPGSRANSKPPSRSSSKPASRSTSQTRSRSTSRAAGPASQPAVGGRRVTQSNPTSQPESQSNTSSQVPSAVSSRSHSRAANPQPPKTTSQQQSESHERGNDEPTEPEDLGPPTPPKKGEDVDLFFFRDKSKVEASVCLICEDEVETSGRELKHTYHYGPTTGITNLRTHLERYHKQAYLDACEVNNWTSLLPGRALDVKVNEAVRPAFSKEGFLKHLVAFVVGNDQALYLLENQSFRQMILYVCPDITDEDIPHRTAFRNQVFLSWRDEFLQLRSDLSKAEGRISFTADGWSDSRRRNYHAITAHWLQRDQNKAIRLRVGLLAFHRTIQHDGKSLANLSIALLKRAKILPKSGHWTLDNISYNNTFMDNFAILLEQETKISTDWVQRKISCFPHVINISTQKVIKAVGDYYKTADTRPPPPPQASSGVDDDEEDPDHSLAFRDPIALVRNLVNAIRASGKRRQEFSQMIADGNERKWWTDAKGQITILKDRQLLRDVATRWDSTYFMISRVNSLRQVITRFIGTSAYGLAAYEIFEEEWAALEEIELILMIPHRVQQTMSSEKTPVLSLTIPIFERFLKLWKALANSASHLSSMIAVGIESAEMYYEKMGMTDAYIVAMFVNPHIRLQYISQHWENMEDRRNAISTLKSVMAKYHSATRNADTDDARDSDGDNAEAAPPSIPKTPVRAATRATYETPARGRMQAMAQRYGIASLLETPAAPTSGRMDVDEEFDLYVRSPVDGSIDMLQFWEAHRLAYPTIFKMAMDYIPIQASSVPSERVFSSAAETDTKKRSRLGGPLMEALQMLKFSLNKGGLDFMTGWSSREVMYQAPYNTIDDDEDATPEELLNLVVDMDPQSTQMDELMGRLG